MSYLAFMQALASVEVEGVETVYSVADGGPSSLDGADLPAQWVALPTLDTGQALGLPLGANCDGNTWQYSGMLIVAVQPLAQDDYGSGLVAALGMADNVVEALEEAAGTLGLGLPAIDVGATPALSVAGIQYWAVQALVRVQI